jgi:hypothetical protein
MTAGNLPTALNARFAFRLLVVALGGNRGHRRDAYDTMGSVTCVTLRPSEKYHRRPACIEETLAIGTRLMVPYTLALKAEVLYLADRAIEALEAINEADVVVKYSEQRWLCAELHRLRGIFLAAVTGEDRQIQNALSAAIDTAKQQKPVSFARRAKATYADTSARKAEFPGNNDSGSLADSSKSLAPFEPSAFGKRATIINILSSAR